MYPVAILQNKWIELNNQSIDAHREGFVELYTILDSQIEDIEKAIEILKTIPVR
jgi:lantibiotic modifying enzyme